MYVALATLLALVVNIALNRLLSGQPFFTVETSDQIVNSFIIAITVVVVAVPEGLPLAVTLSLAYSVAQMKNENNLVRRLEAAETMGGANEICTDKTGTLTENQMTVVQFYSEEKFNDTIEDVSYNTQELILDGCSLNSNSHIIYDSNTREEKRIGSQTECSLLDFVNTSLQHTRGR